MNNKSYNKRNGHSPFRKTVSFTFFLYWFILVVWQNVGGAELRGAADTAVKCMLLLFLCWSFFSKSLRIKRTNLLRILLFVVFQLITLLRTETLSFSVIISYSFTSLFLLLSFGVGNNLEINQRELIQFFYCIIAVVLYTILYTVLMEPVQYLAAFGASNGYGNEFHSFFISSNEFAIYCFYGMVASLVIVDTDTRLGEFERLFILLLVYVFLLHIVLSFSRVTMVCAALFLVVYVFLNKKSRCRKSVFLFISLGLAVCIVSTELRSYLFKVAFKSGNVSSRKQLMEIATEFLTKGSFVDVLLGRGITATKEYIGDLTRYGSVHNGYMQVVLYFGVIGLFWMLAILFSQLLDGIRLLRKDKFVGSLSVSLVLVAAANMVTSTQLIFTSPIDSFFLTAMFIVVPKYMRNAVRNGSFTLKE